MKPLILSLSCLFAAMLFAMPTQEELSKAGPLIQELMRDDLTAMRNGKKTREQVGDAAAGCGWQYAVRMRQWGTMGGENYCGNLLWQSCLTL